MKAIKRMRVVLAGFLLITGMSVAAHAATIAGWDMYGQPGDEASVAGYGMAGISAFDMVRGSGLGASAAGNSFSTSDWDEVDDSCDYIQFGFSVATGRQVSLESLWLGTRSSNTGPGTMGVYTSQDNFSTSVAVLNQPGGTYVNSILDLSGLGLVTGDFYIRLMEIGNTQADGSGDTDYRGTFRITDHYDAGTYTDVQFTGDVSPVPVPAALWLFASGVVALGAARRNG